MERCLYCYKELKEGQVDYHRLVPGNFSVLVRRLSCLTYGVK